LPPNTHTPTPTTITDTTITTITTGPRSAQGIQGLYHVGASNRPGNGVPLVMVGARLLAELIERDLANWGEDAQNAD
jgi:phytoene dehydrogenase-like protein